jgi:hypothetical protein
MHWRWNANDTCCSHENISQVPGCVFPLQIWCPGRPLCSDAGSSPGQELGTKSHTHISELPNIREGLDSRTGRVPLVANRRIALDLKFHSTDWCREEVTQVWQGCWDGGKSRAFRSLVWSPSNDGALRTLLKVTAPLSLALTILNF